MSEQVDKLFTDAYETGRKSVNIGERMLTTGPESHPVVVVLDIGDDGTEHVRHENDIQRAIDERAPAPLRRRGTTVIAELASFLVFVNRYKSEQSTIFADIERMSLECVFNEAASGGAAWRDHRAIYAAPRSPAWIEWTRLDGKEMDQDTFADFIEAHLEHLISGRDLDGKPYPAPVDVLQMARDLTVLTKGTFKRTINPTNGSTILECKNEEDTGSTVIPRAFLIAIPVFDGGAPYQVEARIRMQMQNGRPAFRYIMHRRTEIERDAFVEVRTIAEDQTSLPLYAGKAG